MDLGGEGKKDFRGMLLSSKGGEGERAERGGGEGYFVEGRPTCYVGLGVWRLIGSLLYRGADSSGGKKVRHGGKPCLLEISGEGGERERFESSFSSGNRRGIL